MKRIYVAGPYSADNVLGVLDNIREGLRWSTQLLLAGHAPFCPWLDFHYQLMLRPGEKLTVAQYYAYSLAWLEASDAVAVLPDWERSHGTRCELDRAHELQLPVFFLVDREDRERLGLQEPCQQAVDQ